MPDTLRRLTGPALLGTAAATVYTAPAGITASVLTIHVANVGTVSATFTMSIGTDAAGTRIYGGILIPPGGTHDWSGLHVVTSGEILQAYASVANTLVLTASGVEVS